MREFMRDQKRKQMTEANYWRIKSNKIIGKKDLFLFKKKVVDEYEALLYT